MTRTEMVEGIKEVLKENEFKFMYYGIRFENKERALGDEIKEHSKADLSDKEDEDVRDFPEYGTPEYGELEELNGICAYQLDQYNIEGLSLGANEPYDKEDVKHCYLDSHCYIVGSQSSEAGEDDREIVMGIREFPVVIGKAF